MMGVLRRFWQNLIINTANLAFVACVFAAIILSTFLPSIALFIGAGFRLETHVEIVIWGVLQVGWMLVLISGLETAEDYGVIPR